MRILLLCVGVLVTVVLLFRHGRRQAMTPGRNRMGLQVRYALATLLGAYLSLVLPRSVPETPGSPATLVIVLLLWLIGGALGVSSAASLLGVATAPASQVEGEQ